MSLTPSLFASQAQLIPLFLQTEHTNQLLMKICQLFWKEWEGLWNISRETLHKTTTITSSKENTDEGGEKKKPPKISTGSP